MENDICRGTTVHGIIIGKSLWSPICQLKSQGHSLPVGFLLSNVALTTLRKRENQWKIMSASCDSLSTDRTPKTL